MAASRRRKPVEHEREIIRAAEIEAIELRRAPLIPAPPVDCIPGYTITREIGRGGMAVIYEAQQKEPPRAVALKIMRGGPAVSSHRLRLFRQETETLAKLSCPNIAAIYGAGSTNDGRHYFAMELVRGSPVTEHVHLQKLSLRQTLLLFQQICQAVQYAHQRGVIHRDLKPSNIIVDMEGNPKVLDFGLARMTDADETMRAMMAESGKIMGTLPYMSPEQAAGDQDNLDVRSDVYSLGVVLYELLTERLPYELAGVSSEEARCLIREKAPPKPSRFRRQVRGDLELVVLKALEKEPAKRYQNAAVLGEDIGRYLRRQAVTARTPTIPYLARKFVERQKLPVALSFVLLLMVAGFAVWAQQQAEQQRLDEQQSEQRRLRDVELSRQKTQAENRDRVLAGQFWEDAIATTAGLDVLDAAAKSMEAIEHNYSDSPALAATLHETLSKGYARLGEAERATEQLDAAAAALRKSAEQHIRRSEFALAESLLQQEYDLRHRFDKDGARETARLLAKVCRDLNKLEQSRKWRNRADGEGHTDGRP